MADPVIRIKRSAVAGKIPTTNDVQLGEFAINTYDGKVYIEQDQSGVGVGTTIITINPWSVGLGSNVYDTYFTAGDVGIGTTNPTSKLHVVGVVSATSFYGDGSNLTGVGAALSVSNRNGVGGPNSNEVSNVTAIRFNGPPFTVTDLGNGEVLITSESTFKTWYVNGQPTLVASGDDYVELIAGTGIAITTRNTATGVGTGEVKAVTITATGGGGSGISTQWQTTSVGINTLSNVGIGTTNPTSKLTVSGDGLFTGVVTASSFNGNASSATYATTAGIATYATTAGVSTYASTTGIATYASSAGIATYATSSGIATSVIGGIGSITQLNVTGLSTFTNGPVLIGSGTSTGTASQRLQVTGGAYVSGNVGIGTTNPTSTLTVGGAVQIQQDSSSNNRLIFRGQPGSSYRWNIDNYGSSNQFRIFREDDLTSANGFAPFSISTTGTLTATAFVGDGSGLTNLPSGGGGGAGAGGTWATTTVGIHTLKNVGIGTTNPTSTLTVAGNASITGILTVDQVYTSNNGNGTNVRIGDDLWIGDINVANTIRLSGAQDSTKAFVVFGTGDAIALGRTGTGPLYYGGDVNIVGTGTISQLNVSGISTFAGITTVTGTTLFAKQINVSGVVTASSFSGNASSATYATSSGIATYATTAGVSTSVNGGTASVTSLNVTGISTFSGIATHTASIFGTQANFTGVTTASSFVKSGGTGSQFLKADGSVDTNTYVTSSTSPIKQCNTSNFLSSNTCILNISGAQNNFLVGCDTGYSITSGSNNTFFGDNAGLNNTTGNYNTFIGRQAGQCNTSGSSNTFIGNQAGYCSTIGNNNTFIGEKAGYCNSTGSDNVFIGTSTGTRNTTGSCNFFMGRQAGGFNTTGNNNIFIGNLAGLCNTFGCHNFFAGCCAGHKNTTGCSNTFIGREAGRDNTFGCHNNFFGEYAGNRNTTGCNNTFIGAAAGLANLTGSNNTFIGRFAGCTNTYGSHNFFTGLCAGLLQTTGCYNFFAGLCAGYCNVSGNSNTFIGRFAGSCTSFGSNNTFIGNQAGQSNTTGFYNTFLGVQAGLCNTSGCNNFYVGPQAGLLNTTGCNNTFIGQCAGYCATSSNNFFAGLCSGYATTTGNNNIFIGNQAGFCNTTGNNNFIAGCCAGYKIFNGCNNVIIGNCAGFCNDSAVSNIFLGLFAGRCTTSGGCNFFAGHCAGISNTTGASNIFFGAYSGACNTTGRYNFFSGRFAGFSNTTGRHNIAIGFYAGCLNTTGCSNTFIGNQAGRCNTFGRHNNFFGEYSGYNNTTGCNNIFIGNQAGRCNTFGNNNIFVGACAGYYNISGCNNVIIGLNRTETPVSQGSNQLVIGVGSTDWIVGNENFNIGIGTTNPTSKLHVGGNGLFTGIVTAASRLFVGTGKTIGDGGVGIGTTDIRGAITIGNMGENPTGMGGRIVFAGRDSNLYASGGQANISIGHRSNWQIVDDPDVTGIVAANNISIGNNAGQQIRYDLNVSIGNNTHAALYNAKYGTAVGSHAGELQYHGSNNLHLGSFTGIAQTGHYRIIIGSGYGDAYLGGYRGYKFDAPDSPSNAGYGDATEGKSYQLAIGIRTSTAPSNYWIVGNENFNIGIGTTNPTSKLHVGGNGLFTGIVTATTFIGNLTGTATTASSVAADSVGLGTHTYGDYVRNITGTANQITVTSGTGEGSTPTLSVPNQFTAPQDVTVTRDLQVNRNLNVNGTITIGGTSATLFTNELKIYDPDIVLGFRTDAFGNDVSTDNTANHGGVALASTEGTPLVQLFIAGIETVPATYKKIMWFKAGEFAGLGTDAWLFNYGVGIGSTQFPSGTRLAAGSVQFTENDLAVVRDVNASGVGTFSTLKIGTGVTISNGIVTATSFYGDGTNLTNTGSTLSAASGTQRVVLTSLTTGTMTSSSTDSNLTFDGDTDTLKIGNDVTICSGIITATDFNSASDARLKENIKIIDNPLDKILKLDGVNFSWKNNGKKSLGVIAQDVEKVLPELVSGETTKVVNYNGIIGLLIECVKKQQEEIDELRKLIDK